MPRIVVALTTDQQSYQREQAAAARAAANGMVDLELLFAEGNPELQRQQLSRYFDVATGERPFAMVVEAMSAEGAEKIGRRAAQAGIGWILLHEPPYIEYLSKEYPDLPIASVCADNAQIGALQAEQFRRLLPSGGRIVYVEGPGANAATIERRRGMMQGIWGTGIQVGKTVAADWTAGWTEQALSLWLRRPSAFRPDLVGAQNDSMALGALQALKSAKPEWSDIPVTGVDGLREEGERLVKKGVLTATVLMPSTAGVGVRLALRALGGERISPVVVPVESYPPLERLAR